MLGREIRSVLDVGCGEARWREALLRMRREVAYVRVDSSEHVVKRYGKRRWLAAMRRLARGVVYIEAFAAGDDFVGDREGWHPRSART